MKIEYRDIEDHGEYVIGIADFGTDEDGHFTVRVSGSRNAILDYAASADFIQIRLRPLEQAELNQFREVAAEAAKIRQAQLVEQPDEAWRLLQTHENANKNPNPTDLRVDRLIEIESADPLEMDRTYHVSFYIDPWLAPGARDVYSWPGSLFTRSFSIYAGWLSDGPQLWRGTVSNYGGATEEYDYYGAYLIRGNERIPIYW